MRTRGNKAQNDKDSILADTKNLLVILHPVIQKMPKIERMEGAPHEMKMACYSIIKHFTTAKECPEVRADNIRSTLFMDDCVMVVPERLHGYALSLFPVLRQRLAAKGVRMNEKKFYDQPYQYGFEFLGSHIKPYRIHINNDTFGRATGRVREFNALANKYDYIDALVSSINSYTGILKNRTDFKRLQDLRRSIAPQWWSMCEWDARRQCLVCRPGYTIRERLNKQYNLHLKRHGKSRNSRPNQCAGVPAA